MRTEAVVGTNYCSNVDWVHTVTTMTTDHIIETLTLDTIFAFVTIAAFSFPWYSDDVNTLHVA